MKFYLNPEYLVEQTGLIESQQGYHMLTANPHFMQDLLEQVQRQDSRFIPPKHSAHISVIYPEETVEQTICSMSPVHYRFDQPKSFTIAGKEYWAITVESGDLQRYRDSRGLPSFPCFRGTTVPFHMTFARRIVG